MRCGLGYWEPKAKAEPLESLSLTGAVWKRMASSRPCSPRSAQLPSCRLSGSYFAVNKVAADCTSQN